MDLADLLKLQTVALTDRTARPMLLDAGCILYRQRFTLIVAVPTGQPPRQLVKSAEHAACQLLQLLQLDSSKVDFLHFQPSATPQWRRWRFRWVGSSPLMIADEALTESALQGYLQRLLNCGRAMDLPSMRMSASA